MHVIHVDCYLPLLPADLSAALCSRYYYKPGILEPVVGRRLVYAFGPNADWKTPPDVSLH